MHPPKRTIGLSNKMLTTLYAAVGAQVIAMAVNFASSGKFDRVEAAQTLGIALTAAGGALFGYLAQPDKQDA